jgi:hypothetical protein
MTLRSSVTSASVRASGCVGACVPRAAHGSAGKTRCSSAGSTSQPPFAMYNLASAAAATGANRSTILRGGSPGAKAMRQTPPSGSLLYVPGWTKTPSERHGFEQGEATWSRGAMATGDEYVVNAAECCQRMAMMAANEQEMRIWLGMAEHWLYAAAAEQKKTQQRADDKE